MTKPSWLFRFNIIIRRNAARRLMFLESFMMFATSDRDRAVFLCCKTYDISESFLSAPSSFRMHHYRDGYPKIPPFATVDPKWM